MIFKKIDKIFPRRSSLRRVVSSYSKVIQRIHRRFWFYLYVLFILLAPFAQIDLAFAPITPKKVEARVDNRVVRLKSFLAKYNSPLAPYAGRLVAVADRYGLDWRLLPAIAGTESTLGKHYISGTYNPFGWGNGRIRFTSWEQGIEKVGKALYEKYYRRGERPLTIEQVGKIYATSPHWPKSVRLWMGRMNGHQVASLLK